MQENEPPSLAIGATIRDPTGDQYIVEGLLGQGGFGGVYLVRDRRFRRSLFALKEVIDPDKRDRERFLFEGEVLERLHHWALPHVYRVFEHPKLKRVYILMDYIQGKNLRTLLHEQPEQRLSLPLVLTLMAPVVDALIYLHHQNPPIVHCDLKPANIIMPERAEETMLVDFGLAKEYLAENTTTVIRHGSPGYAAPEQYGGGTTPRTDIYGLGATFYTLLTGVVPIDAIKRITEGNRMDLPKLVSQIAPDVPVAVAETIHRAMSMSADDRFCTIEEFWQEMKSHVPELPTSATPQLPPSYAPPPPLKQGVKNTFKKEERPSARLRKRRARRKVLLACLCALLFFGIVGAGFWGYLGIFGSRSSSASSTTPTVVLTAPSTPTLGAGTARTGVNSNIVGTYKGTINDFTTNMTAPLMLKNMRQSKGRINGFLIVGPNGPSVPGNGALSGTIDGNNIQFIVSGPAGQTLLFFQGSMLSSNVLSGNFYSCSSVKEGFCSQAPGSYGYWSVQ